MGNSFKERLAQMALAVSVGGNAAADPPKAQAAAIEPVREEINLAAMEQARLGQAMTLAIELPEKIKRGVYIQLTPELASNYSEMAKQAGRFGGDASMPIYLDREDVGRSRFRIARDMLGKPFMLVSDAAHKQTDAFVSKYVSTRLTDADLIKFTPAEGTDFSPRVLKAYAALSKKQGLGEVPKIYVDNANTDSVAIAQAWLTNKNRKAVVVNRAFLREPEDAQLAILAHENDHLQKNRFSVSDYRERHNNPALSMQDEREADKAVALTCRPHSVAGTFARADAYMMKQVMDANPGMQEADARTFIERVAQSGPSAYIPPRRRIETFRQMKENQPGCIGVEPEKPAPDLRDTLAPRGR